VQLTSAGEGDDLMIALHALWVEGCQRWVRGQSSGSFIEAVDALEERYPVMVAPLSVDPLTVRGTSRMCRRVKQ